MGMGLLFSSFCKLTSVCVVYSFKCQCLNALVACIVFYSVLISFFFFLTYKIPSLHSLWYRVILIFILQNEAMY